jgi:phage host-nuclease inhibitor protein Gam
MVRKRIIQATFTLKITNKRKEMTNMATTLAQTRSMTLADAHSAMEQLAHCACRIAVAKAKKAKRITEIESDFAEKMKNDEREAELITGRIKEFCRANPHFFTKPRKIKGPFGEFGLQTVSDLMVDDPEMLMQVLLDRGYDDCVKTVRSVIKDQVRSRIEGGEDIPGCTIRISENDPVVKVAPKMLKDAVEKS